MGSTAQRPRECKPRRAGQCRGYFNQSPNRRSVSSRAQMQQYGLPSGPPQEWASQAHLRTGPARIALPSCQLAAAGHPRGSQRRPVGRRQRELEQTARSAAPDVVHRSFRTAVLPEPGQIAQRMRHFIAPLHGSLRFFRQQGTHKCSLSRAVKRKESFNEVQQALSL